MDDRDLMENMLLLEKGVCDLFMHGAIESSTANVHQTFSDSLNTALRMQEQIYSKMEARGWYQTQQADQSKMNSLKMKYSS
ncbi:MAG: spore coat protein [Clostridia bacterium]|nr:spore coat protein [Clostridia bacterium]